MTSTFFGQDSVLPSSAQATPATSDYFWWSSLRHGGCVISPSRLSEFFPAHAETPLSSWHTDRLRRAVTRLLEEGGKGALDRLLDTVLIDVLGLQAEFWHAGPNVDTSWSAKSYSGESIKPRRMWQEPNGGILPLFVADEGSTRGRKAPALGLGRGRRAVARVIEWLRRKNLHVALLTNGNQWRLIHAGNDYDAWCEWDVEAWFIEGKTSAQVEALRLLLGKTAVTGPSQQVHPPLLAAILATRRGQAELSAVLGERVRQAVELLLSSSRQAIDQVRSGDQNTAVSNRDVYIAAVRIIMRVVVILFAESRDLLPRNHPIYYRSYSLQGLIEVLDREGGGKPMERLRDRYAAWPRLLGLFRMLFRGSPHELLLVTRYGGGLFTPGDSTSNEPILRALAALESSTNEIADGIIATVLDLLTRAPLKVRQGRGATVVMSPVDFSQLDTEYLGILYEGLLDYELRRVEEAIPVLFLNLGDQPALPLTRLEEMDDKSLAGLVEKLKVKASKSSDEDAGEDEPEESETEDAEDDAADELPIAAEGSASYLLSPVLNDGDQVRAYQKRASSWARRCVEAGKLVSKPKKQTPDKLREYETEVEKTAASIIARILLPGEYYLVRFGGTRKGAGSFYTKPALAGPTIRRTLESLCYGKAEESKGSSEEQLLPRTPAQILDLKVADIAVGSGSFVVGSLRYLTTALYEALFAHGWLVDQPDGSIRWGNPDPPIPAWFVEFLEDVPGINEPAPRTPEEQSPEDRIKARLKRVIVERCVYGVDLDPLAVELARLALWIETMDPYLPFSFLDHKIKCGNSLVGCWFDRFQDYPALAWEREGGDKGHSTSVHYAKEAWTKAIKKLKADVIKPELAQLVATMTSGSRGELPGLFRDQDVHEIHTRMVAAYQRLHERLSAARPEDQAKLYREAFADNPDVRRLRAAFDTWCSAWFWPADKLNIAPTPSRFLNPPEETRAEVESLACQIGFFHWELEFPDVFSAPGSGFSAMVGNPPWENPQPNPKEWFSNEDPLFRTYGRLESLDWMRLAFAKTPDLERNWLVYNAQSKAFSNWVSNTAEPTGIGVHSNEEAESKMLPKALRDVWRSGRVGRISYADPNHPFALQMGRIFTYRLFLEACIRLLIDNGRCGLIIPSAIYTDSWSGPLRNHLLEKCRWDWLFGFENREKVFDIDSRFKFCPVIVEKSGRTESIHAAFMHRDLVDWAEAEQHVLTYPRERIEQFSPKSKAILEIRSQDDLAILEKMYSNGVLLGDSGPCSWNIQYALEFMMNSDAKLFPPRPQWEAQGYEPDGYGHWIKGDWRLITDVLPGREPKDLWREPHFVLHRNSMKVIALQDIKDVALPLYEGRMIGQFDFSQKGWVSGKGRGAVWDDVSWAGKEIMPQYLMALSSHLEHAARPTGTKVSHMRIGSATNERSAFATLLDSFAGGDTAAIFWCPNTELDLALTTILNSFAFDYLMRLRLGGLHLDYHVFEQNALPSLDIIRNAPWFLRHAASVSLGHLCFCMTWMSILKSNALMGNSNWRSCWALARSERLRVRCILDAWVANAYGLDESDFRQILVNCDHPVESVSSKTFSRQLDPKGFWRVDKGIDPELRHTVLSLVAFSDLQSLIREHGEEEALRQFMGTGTHGGWMLPETLRLSDYDLGHDDRARQPQQVSPRLGPRFYDWQLTQPAEESWAECRVHADKIRAIRETKTGCLTTTTAKKARKEPAPDKRARPQEIVDDLFAQVVEVGARSEQPILPRTRREALLACLLHLIQTRPGMREDEYSDALAMATRFDVWGGSLSDDAQEYLTEHMEAAPLSLIRRSKGQKGESWPDLWKTLQDRHAIEVVQEGVIRRFFADQASPVQPTLSFAWPLDGFGELVYEALTLSPAKALPVNSREEVEV